jgi:serine/threonine protein kinase
MDELQAEPDDYDDTQDLSNLNISEKLELIKNEKGKRVIAKLTSRSDIVEAEMSKREVHQLSRHYVPAIISIHHTIQHAAYAEAMAEPSYCITMEGADTTAENLLLDMRRSGGTFAKEHLRSIAISLLHVHDRGLVHGDFGTHNVALFGKHRWKILGIGGSIDIGQKTNPKRGFFHPPEAVVLETRNVSLGEKNVGAAVVAIDGAVTYDIWAFGTIMYEALAGLPLSPYRSAYKAKRAMTTAELFKVGQWDDRSLRKALRHIDDENAKDLIKKLLHPNPETRAQSMREALGHPYFGVESFAEKPPFTKSSSARSAEPVVLKIYSDEFMAKMGWSDTDVAEQFMPKEQYPINDIAIREEEDDEDQDPNPAEENEPVVQEMASEEDPPTANKHTELPSSSYDEFVSFVGSPTRTTEPARADEQTKAAPESISIPAEPLVESTITEAPRSQPQSTPDVLSFQPSTPHTQTMIATKPKSKFSVKGLTSKFGKK